MLFRLACALLLQAVNSSHVVTPQKEIDLLRMPHIDYPLPWNQKQLGCLATRGEMVLNITASHDTSQC